MFAVESLVLALIALAVGVGIGVLLTRNTGAAQHSKDLEQSLVKAKEDLGSYQQDVAKHFIDTAQKVADLTKNYRDLNQHLADGAMRLTSTEITRDLLEASGNKDDNNEPVELSAVEPPKDWAPRIPGTHGMLSEEFGLKDSKDEPESEPAPSDPTPKQQ